MKPLIVRKNCLRKDSWTGGDFTQYLAQIDKETLIVCRHSSIPLIFGVLGFAMLVAIGMLIVRSPSHLIDWWGAFIVSSIGFMLMGPVLVELITPWRWMVQLHKPLKARRDGQGNTYWYRDY